MLTKKSVEESQLLIAAIPKLAAGRNTWKEIMSTVAWSLDILFSGTCPKKDKDGQALEKERGKRVIGELGTPRTSRKLPMPRFGRRRTSEPSPCGCV